MLVYLICLVLFLSLTFFQTKKHFWFAILLIFIVMGVRDMVGSMDIYNYAYSYEMYDIKGYLEHDTAEIGFQLYTIFLKLFSNNRYFYFFITAFVIGFLQLFPAWKLTGFDKKEFYLLCFFILCKFYLLDFIILRQLMSIGFIWLAFSYYFQQQKLQAILFFIVALSFHRSVFIILPFIFLLKINLDFKKMMIIYTTLLALIFSGVLHLGVNHFLELVKHIPYFDKASIYASRVAHYKWIYLIEIPIIITTLYYINFLKTTDYQKRILSNSVFIYGFFTIISIVSPIFIRMAWALFIAFAFTISIIIYQLLSKRAVLYFKGFMITYFCAIFFKFLITYHGGDMLPYKSIFDNFDRKGYFDYMEYRPKMNKI